MMLDLVLRQLGSLQRGDAMLGHDAAGGLSHTFEIEASTCAAHRPGVIDAFLSSKTARQASGLVMFAALSSSPDRSLRRRNGLILGMLGHRTAFGP
jgi:hypothetical protein